VPNDDDGDDDDDDDDFHENLKFSAAYCADLLYRISVKLDNKCGEH